MSLENSKEMLKEHMERIGVDMPKHIVLPVYQQDFDGPRERYAIKKAKEDPNIKGIYLELSEIQAGIASVEEIRNALLEFKESKKFIICYSDFYSQKAYYLATVAD